MNAVGIGAARRATGCSAGCRRPGARTRRSARRAMRRRARFARRSRNAGMRDTGTLMSCLMLGPSRRCASGMCSRSAHSAAACASDCAIVASRAMFVADGVGERRFDLARAAASRRRRRRPAPARTRRGRAAGRAAPETARAASATQSAEISSKPVSRSPSAPRIARSSATAARDVGDARPTRWPRCAAAGKASAPRR